MVWSCQALRGDWIAQWQGCAEEAVSRSQGMLFPWQLPLILGLPGWLFWS